MSDRTLGAYQRHEKHDAADFAKARFATDSHGGKAWRSNAGLWHTSWGFVYSDDEMAAAGWSPVRECPDPELHDIVALSRAIAAVTPCSCSAQRALAEKAEKERDEARREAESLSRQLHDAQHDADMSRSELEAEPRPLTPADITDEMVERGRTAYPHGSERLIRAILTAAFTVPARPEGAEAFDPIVDAAIRGHSDITSPDVVHAISDALAEEALRDPSGPETAAAARAWVAHMPVNDFETEPGRRLIGCSCGVPGRWANDGHQQHRAHMSLLAARKARAAGGDQR
jgi:hypothetical protein